MGCGRFTASSFSRQLGSSSESTASEPVLRQLFSPGSVSAGDSSSRPQKPTKETEQLGTLTPQKEFVDPNLVRPQHFERPKMRSGCKVKTSSSEQYSGGTPSTGLVASFDFELYAMVESTLAVPLSTTVAGTELPVTSLHQTGRMLENIGTSNTAKDGARSGGASRTPGRWSVQVPCYGSTHELQQSVASKTHASPTNTSPRNSRLPGI